MINRIMSATTLGILPMIYLSGSNTGNGSLFAMMSSSPIVCLLLIAVAAAATLVSFKPKLLSNTNNWTAVVASATIILAVFSSSLVSQKIGYGLTYYIEPLDLIILAELATAMLLAAVIHQPVRKPPFFSFSKFHNLGTDVRGRALTSGWTIRQIFSTSATRPPRLSQ